MNKKFLVGLICFGITNLIGYDFTFYNYTNNTVNVRIKLAASTIERHVDIAPHGGYIFSFQGNNRHTCLKKIFINNELKRNGRVCWNASFYIQENGTPADPAHIDVVME